MTTYTYTTLNDPLATSGTVAQGINDAGQSVGYYVINGGSTPQGFLYSGGTYTTIDDPLTVGEPATFAQGINDAGQIVGYFAMGGVYNGFLYSGGTYTTINDPLGTSTSNNPAVGINNMGQIVGDYTDSSGVGLGYLYSGGNFITIMPLSASATDVTGINNAGQIVGVYNDSNGGLHGFLDSNGSFTTIDDPLASAVKGGTIPLGINNAGQIVGYYYDNSGGIHGFLKSGGSYTTIDYPLAKFTFVTGINNAGEIVGWYDDGSEKGYASYHGFLAAPADAPTITGTVANQVVKDNATIDLFASVKVIDPNNGQTETVTISFMGDNGTLTDPNAVSDHSVIGTGSYKVTGTADQVTADLNALIFHPTPYQVTPGKTVTTEFTIAVNDSQAGLSATDNTTSVIAKAVAPNFTLLQQDASNFLLAENAGANTNPARAEAAINGSLTKLLTDLGNFVTHPMTSTDASVPISVLANLTVPVTNVLSDALFQSPNLAADNATLLGVANSIGHGFNVV
jgi:probable HAF family extracellular repeat protein